MQLVTVVVLVTIIASDLVTGASKSVVVVDALLKLLVMDAVSKIGVGALDKSELLLLDTDVEKTDSSEEEVVAADAVIVLATGGLL